ncbi:MAG TPA: zf-HC2 domain-containing protein [Caulobacteraceae bacterium]|nr:zf-HC2 domain-containing protein [Caulobacteraceae bacterium]
MSFTDERLSAYVDGELDEPARAEVEAAIAADPALAERVATHRRLRLRLSDAYAGALDEPIPDAWTQLTRSAPSPIVDLARERARRRPAPAWTGWAAIAASLAAGLVIGRLVLPSQGLISGAGASMIARGPLDRALTEQLASAQAGAPIRIGLSYRSNEGRYCRTFQARAGLAGLACREGDAWRVRMAVSQPPAPRTEYRTAGAETPAAVLSLVDETIAGEPLDARAEAAARARHWRP